jgi:hypothetical protein
MTRWIRHLLAIDVDMEPFTEVRDADFTWYAGLDAEGTKIGDALWNGEELSEALRNRIVGLYRLTFRDPSGVIETARGGPVYLILAAGADNVLRFKPQNLVTGLPLKTHEGVT